eukprot:gene7474-11798_t
MHALALEQEKFNKLVDERYESISKIALKTPLQKSIYFSSKQTIVFLKLENVQHTGSFKLRGATSKILSLPENVKEVYTASTGNHGLGVSFASNKLNIKASIYCPKTLVSTKRFGIESLGGIVVDKFDGCLDAELNARKDAENQKIPYISPYNDIDVMIGQGTIGKEIVEQMDNEELDAIFVSVGGGGLIGGIASYLKEKMNKCKVYGVQPKNSQVMYKSIVEGKILQNVEEFETISDGTAGGLENDCVSFGYCQKFVDEWILVSEDEIKRAMYMIAEKEKFIIEGSAAMAFAGYLKSNQKGKVAVVLCGKNISIDKFQTCFLK